MKRRTFLRWAGAALLAGFIGTRLPELEEESELEWQEEPGELWRQIVDDGRKDSFVAYGSSYANLMVRQPNGAYVSLPL